MRLSCDRRRRSTLGRWRSPLSLPSGPAADDNGSFTAVDAASGNIVWTYVTQQQWQASPMTYMVNGKQYVAITAPAQLMVFALNCLIPRSAVHRASPHATSRPSSEGGKDPVRDIAGIAKFCLFRGNRMLFPQHYEVDAPVGQILKILWSD
jgi:hypothetical protein